MMEKSSGTYNFPEFSDLNCENENEGEDDCDEDLFEEPLKSDDNDLQATNQVQSVELTLEEVEKRLEIGNIVENEHIAFALYCKYANVKGFSVRKGKGIRFKDGCGLLQGKFFLCSCEGAKNNKCSTSRVPKYQKLSFRCDCKAKLKIARRKGDVWKVTKFDKEHNHELYASDQAYLLRSSRNLTDQQELMLTSMVKFGIPAFKAFGFLESAAHGRENLGFLRKDALNCLYRKTKVENSDAMELLQHFVDKSNNESEFYWKMEVDDDQRLMNFFCRDYQSKIDFDCFGDLLSFDTTYRTNKYELICAPFVGINHHNENIMFGFALMSDETQSSFEWLFKEFLKSMGDKQPGVIFTDQCQAMMNAIDIVFPDAHHRLCQWHINQNAPSHFGGLNNEPEFHHLWVKCMKYCESEEEFEATWKEMEDNYGIGGEHWFKIMYKLRHRWATAFSSQIFSAGLLATSRSEGTNSALKKKIGNKTSSLVNCVSSYEEVLNSWRIREKEKDTSCRHNKITPLVKSPILECVVEVYTTDMYKLFEKELIDTMRIEAPRQIPSVDSSLLYFQVKSHGQSSRYRIVQYDPQEFDIKCSCHKFETVGIFCCHVLKVFDALNVCFISEKYIRKRWTKAAKSGAYVDQCYGRGKDGTQADQNYTYEMAFVTHATKEVHDTAMHAKAHGETREILTKHIACAKEEIAEWNAENLNDSSTHVGLVVEEGNVPLVRDPLTAKSRGITNVQKRHWDAKKKKTKGKTEALKRTKSMKYGGQSSQSVRVDQPAQVDFGYSQEARNAQPCVQTMSQVIRDIGGNVSMGRSEYTENAYPFGEINLNMQQDWRPPN